VDTSTSAYRLATTIGTLPDGPAYRSLADAIRLLVVDGRLLDGTRLPSERALAQAMGLSRTTTTRAYDELRRRGVLHSRQGSGSVLRVPTTSTTASSLIVDPDDPDTIALTYSAPSGPSGLTRAFGAAAEQLPSLLTTTGYLPDGLPALREIVAHEYTASGLPTDPDQVIVTNGAQGAISLVGRTFGRAGAGLLVEGTSYPHGVESLTGFGYRTAPLPIGDDPWDVDAASALAPSVSAAYLIPDFHNPTGAVMSAATRARLAHTLRRHRVLTVVDESMRRLDLAGGGLPPSYAVHDPDAIVVDSLSKILWGGLRIGWIRAPRRHVTALLQSRMRHDLGTAAFDQLVAAEVLRHDHHLFDESVERLRRQRGALVGMLAEGLPDWDVPVPAGGPNLWVGLPSRSSSQLVAAAAQEGLLLTPGPRFTLGAPSAGERHLRIPCTAPEHVAREAVGRLARAWRSVTSGRRCEPAGAAVDLIA
jgi:DNA-binding transcriptional MocR family regulator